MGAAAKSKSSTSSKTRKRDRNRSRQRTNRRASDRASVPPTRTEAQFAADVHAAAHPSGNPVPPSNGNGRVPTPGFVPPVGGGVPPTIAQADRLGLLEPSERFEHKHAAGAVSPLKLDRDVDPNRLMPGLGAQAEAEDRAYRRNEVRAEVSRMLADGSLLTGLTRAIERDRPDLVDREMQAKHPEGYATNRQRQAAVAPPSSRRYEDFVADLDTELERCNALISGLEQRLAFLVGPTEGTAAGVDAGKTRPTPSNMLEQVIASRTAQAAAIRARLEALHESLRT